MAKYTLIISLVVGVLNFQALGAAILNVYLVKIQPYPGGVL